MLSRKHMPAAILTYHSLDDSGSVLSTPPRLFAQQMEMLRSLRARVCSLGELWTELQSGSGERVVAITFDDGFRNVREYGLPVLQRLGFPATVFAVSGFVGRDNGWPTQPATVRRQPLAAWDSLREMSAAGWEIGSHTRTHPDLPDLSDEQTEAELAADKAAIEEAIGRPVETFAYPYGRFHRRHVAIASRHFRLACAATLGYVGASSDPLRLERLDVYYLRSPKRFAQLFEPQTRAYLTVRRRLREFRARLGALT